MMRVMREVRFALTASGPAAPITNSWAGWPASQHFTPHLALRAVVEGAVDPTTGYLVNITLLDRVLRQAALPLVQRAWAGSDRPGLSIAGLVPSLWPACADALAPVQLAALELRASPYLRFGVESGDPHMVTMTESFEFAAAHRLYSPELSEDENRKVFGKCMNPNGHGHNYVVEVSVRGVPNAASGALVELPAFEAMVKQRVIDRFDHKHLNADCPEFAKLNPTVENITRIIWDLLEGGFDGCELHAVRVWETPKTYAEYRKSGGVTGMR